MIIALVLLDVTLMYYASNIHIYLTQLEECFLKNYKKNSPQIHFNDKTGDTSAFESRASINLSAAYILPGG